MEQNNCALKDIFHDYLKTDIYEIAREKGIRGISKCNKEELIQKLSEHLCGEEEAKRYFSCLLDEQIEEFEKAVKERVVYDSERVVYLRDLYVSSYVGIRSDGAVQIAQEIADVYQKISDEVFHQQRRRISFLLACLRTSGFLYGITPMPVLLQMINKVCRPEMTEKELKLLFEEIPAEFREHVIVGETVYHELLYPNDRNLPSVQKEKEYYIPTEKEIRDFNIHRYFSENEEVEVWKGYLIADMGFDREEADQAAERVQRAMSGAEQISEVIGLLHELGIGADTIREAEKLRRRTEALWNHTRMLIHRGFTPEEMNQQKNADKIKKKIYPNDPCPCGSGKKYKNCCRNK